MDMLVYNFYLGHFHVETFPQTCIKHSFRKFGRQEFGAEMPLRRGQALLARFGACSEGKPGYFKVCFLNFLSRGQVMVHD